MFIKYVKMAFRNFVRNKNYTLLNIAGLALGMSVAILITLWIYDELSFNRYHKNYNDIAQVFRNDDTGMTSNAVPTGLGTLLKSEYGEYFKYTALVRQRLEQKVIAYENTRFTQGGYFMQQDGPRMFSLEMVHGTQNGLDDKHTILLSHSLARKLFGDINPVNKIVQMDMNYDLKVTGVYKDLPQNSVFNEATFFAPLDIYLDGWSGLNEWNNCNMWLYVQRQSSEDWDRLSSVIKNATLPYIAQDEAKHHPELFLHPMSKWHLYSKFENGVNVMSERLQMVWLFTIIAIMVVLLACINFVNLNTACSEKRVKEIGVCKTLGSSKIDLISRFLSESLIISCIAAAVSLGTVELSLNFFNKLIAKNLALPWGNYSFWLIIIMFTIMTSLLAGGYPALYLSSFNPVKALKGAKTTGNRLSRKLRATLVILQFAASITLIIGSLIVYKHIQFVKDRPVGYLKDGLITLRPDIPRDKYNVLRNALLNTGYVDAMTESNYSITNTFGWMGGIDWQGKDPGYNPAYNVVVTNPEYGKTIGLQFIDGRDFQRDRITDYEGVIINESAAKQMGFIEPVGKIIKCQHLSKTNYTYKILGVAKDMVKGSPYAETVPTIIFLSDYGLHFTYIRLMPDVNKGIALQKIETAFKNILPDIPFEYEFVQDIHNAKFLAEERTGKLSLFAAILAIIISCLGLLGLSSFIIESKTREIGVRKVLGASVPGIITLLAKDFLKWVGFANLIAWPIAYLVMKNWLQHFAYRIDLTIWPFLLAGLIALTIAMLSISWQAIRAATANPIKALRYE